MPYQRVHFGVEGPAPLAPHTGCRASAPSPSMDHHAMQCSQPGAGIGSSSLPGVGHAARPGKIRRRGKVSVALCLGMFVGLAGLWFSGSARSQAQPGWDASRTGRQDIAQTGWNQSAQGSRCGVAPAPGSGPGRAGVPRATGGSPRATARRAAIGTTGTFGSGSQNVQPPPLWYSGDTHEHTQLCPPFRNFPPGSIGYQPFDRPILDIYQECVRENLNVSAISFWRPSYYTEAEFFGTYVPQITGLEDPLTVGDPNFVLQYSVETSGFSTSMRGHLLALGLADGNFDPEADYPAPNLDLFNAQPDTLTGYAHQAWPNGLTNPAGFLGTDYLCMGATPMDFPNVVALWGAAAPVYAPMDAAFHKIDFLETVDMKLVIPGNISWTGMWYRLLKAGVPVQAVAGTDTNCFTTQSREDPRTWVQIAADPLDHAKWLDGIRTGNYSMSMGPSVFLELEVDGLPAGSEIYLDANNTTTVQAVATFTAAAGVTISDTIEILLDGDVIGTQTFSNLSGASDTFILDITLPKSGWITARTTSLSTHTGFVNAYVDNKPIVDCASSEYFVLYAEYIEYFLDLAVSQGLIEEYVGNSEAEIRAYVQDGAEVFALHRAYDLALPAGIAYAGKGTPSCEGPTGIVSRTPIMLAGTTVRFECFDAPRLATGFLSVGANKVQGGFDMNGANLFVANDATMTMYNIVVDDRGVAYADVPLPTAVGVDLYAQFVFTSTPYCPTTNWTASEAIQIVTQ